MRKRTPEDRKQLEALAKLRDDQIDLSEIPEIKELPSDAVIGRFYRPKKTPITIRIDHDTY